MRNKKKNMKHQSSKKDKPPERGDKESAVLMWLLSQRNDDVEKRIFDEWSYNM
ncbi:MAG: hypothetical protein MR303_11265 [Emergencia sp.]|nr:hypothetical protein [Emergencia sp.]